MIRIVLIGTGQLARHLFRACKSAEGVSVLQVVGRDPASLAFFSEDTAIGHIPDIHTDADIYIIAVSDDSISSVSQQLILKNKLVVHTSGTVPMDAISGNLRRGVLYPLQTFSHHRTLALREVPFCLETEREEDLVLLKELASCLSDFVLVLPSDRRIRLHLGAVMVNNFANHLYYLAGKLLEEQDLPFELLVPLIRETSDKLTVMHPYDAQTGPARRGDASTLARHLELLEDPDMRDIYRIMSQSIQHTYDKKL